MDLQHSVPAAKNPEVSLRWEALEKALPTDAQKVSALVAELRHLLENGCELTTALDLLDEAEAALNEIKRHGASRESGRTNTEKVNLVQMLGKALSNSASLIAGSNTVVLRRQRSKVTVFANKQELRALLDDAVRVALDACASAPAPRILRIRIHNDHRNLPTLIFEHSGACDHPSRTVARQAAGVELHQDHGRCTIALTFLNRG